jgi:FAD/FMN-containing dehydrogenase
VLPAMHPVAVAEASEQNRDWGRSAWQALKPFSTGGNYITFQTADEGADRATESYRVNLERLREIKAIYDPNNVFRVNRNITPKER